MLHIVRVGLGSIPKQTAVKSGECREGAALFAHHDTVAPAVPVRTVSLEGANNVVIVTTL